MPEFRNDSYATAESRRAVYELLSRAWPRLGERIPLMDPVGASWHDVSTPFVLWEGEDAIAHAGVLEMELVVDGTPTPVCGIHAVVTHPDHRRSGHMRDLMERAMEFAAARYPTTILFGDPPLYDRYGFRLAPRHVFRAPAPEVEKREPMRPIGDDLPWLKKLLERRTPISNRLGVVRSGHMYLCDSILGFGDLSATRRTDDYAVAYVVRDDTLILLDVVARELPPLEDVLARIPDEFSKIRFGFTPDRFSVSGVTIESFDDDPVMVKGPWPASGSPRDFPAMAVC